MRQRGPKLRRQLGLIDAVAIDLGAIIGAGIFVALGQAAGLAGGALPLAVVMAAVVAFLTGLAAAELGVSYPRAGGPYEYGYVLLAPVAGFSAGWLYMLTNLVATTTFTLAFASYLQPLLPGVSLRAVAVGLAVGVWAINLFGVQGSRHINNVLVAFKVGVLVIFIAVGLARMELWRPQQFVPFGWDGLVHASAILFFAFAGFARTTVLAEEIRDPTHNVPRSIIDALAISTVLYVGVAIVGLGLAGPAGLAGSEAPLRDALAPTGLVWAQFLVSLGGLVATTDVLLTTIWSLSRMVYAMARRGDLPEVLSRVDARGVPRLAVMVIGAIVVVLSAGLSFAAALNAASLSQLLYYSIMDASALRLGRHQRLYPWGAPLAGLVLCLALAAFLPLQSVLAVAVVLAVGLLYFALWHAWRGRRGPGHL